MPDRGRIDGVLLSAVIFLCFFGALMVYSSSAIVATVESSSQTAYLRNLLPKLGLGAVALLVLMNLPHQIWNGRLSAGQWPRRSCLSWRSCFPWA